MPRLEPTMPHVARLSTEAAIPYVLYVPGSEHLSRYAQECADSMAPDPWVAWQPEPTGTATAAQSNTNSVAHKHSLAR